MENKSQVNVLKRKPNGLHHTFSRPRADDIQMEVLDAAAVNVNEEILLGEEDDGERCGPDEAHV